MKKLSEMPMPERIRFLVYRFGRFAYINADSAQPREVSDKADKLIEQLVAIADNQREIGWKNGKRDPVPENY